MAVTTLTTTTSSSSSSSPPRTSTQIPLPYTLFFLYIEPLTTLLGAISAHFTPDTYLALTYPPSSSSSTAAMPIATEVTVVLNQLSNLYLAFALCEGLVLRSTADVKVWRVFLLVLLIADLGHVLACLPAALASNNTSSAPAGVWRYYGDVRGWNAMDWGNLGYVYVAAGVRGLFLSGVGLPKRVDDDDDDGDGDTIVMDANVDKGKKRKEEDKEMAKTSRAMNSATSSKRGRKRKT